MTQATLYNFQEITSDSSDLYKELQALGYVDNHKRAILELLWDLKPHTTKEVQIAGGAQYNARVKELRSDGWSIVSERALGTPAKFYFRLQYKERRWID